MMALLGACKAGEPGYSTTESNLVIPSPSNVSFPSTQVGQTSAPIQIQLSASNNTTNTITAINYSCADFSVQATLPGTARKVCVPSDPGCRANGVVQCAQAVPCGPESEIDPYYFTATFHPNAAVTSSCSLSIAYTVNGNPQTPVSVMLTGTGSAPPLSAVVTPSSLGFGGVRIGTASNAATATLHNTGGAPLDVSSVTVSNPLFRIVSGPTGASTLPAGASQGFGITCNPGATGPSTGTLNIANNYAPLGVSLSCTGVDSNLDISPSPAAIAQARVGEPQMTTLDLVNSGGAPMAIENVAISGGDIMMMAAPAPGTNLAPGASASTTVKFMATAVGDTSGTLTVTYDGGKTRTTEISASAVRASMSISPSGSVDLGPVCIGQQTSKTFSVVANDQGPFLVQDVSSIGDGFTYAATGLPASIHGNGTNTYTFAVTAAPTTEGASVGTLTVTTDIPGAEPRQLDLSVTGLAEGVTGTPSELYLGGVEPGTTTVGQYVTVTNCGAAPVTLSTPRIEGTDLTEFAIVTFPDSPTIDAQGSARWLIIAKPTAVGEKNAVFVADYDGGQVMISLVGDGLGTTGGTTGDANDSVPSYYSCSAGGATAVGAWPLALAFGVVARRRRK